MKSASFEIEELVVSDVVEEKHEGLTSLRLLQQSKPPTSRQVFQGRKLGIDFGHASHLVPQMLMQHLKL